jgi:cation-transporting ATPase 13A2
MCFDKTGTLTKNSMEVVGFEDFTNNTLETVINYENNTNNDNNFKRNILFKSFATCHGVYVVENEYMGDELDVKMLEFSKYSINNEDT